MKTVPTINDEPIVIATSAVNYPPGCGGGQALGVATWIQVNGDWFRWEGTLTRFRAAIECAGMFDSKDFFGPP